MKSSIYRKEMTETGSVCTVTGELVVTMNYDAMKIPSNNPSTHEVEWKNIAVHKVEIFINNRLHFANKQIRTEEDVLKTTETLLEDLKIELKKRANTPMLKSFDDKMNELLK